MKKSFNFFAAIWALSLALFNVVVFLAPNEVGRMTKFGGAFWVGYIFITLAFIGQLACGFFAFKADNAQKLLYNIPLIKISYTGLVVMLIAGTVCMAVPGLPNWLGIIICLLVLAFTAFGVIKAAFAANTVAQIDDRIKVKTAFIKMLTADAEQLMNRAQTIELKAVTKKVYEAVRYSDPMSNAALVEVEEKIEKEFSALEGAVNAEDSELATEISDQLISLIDSRNKKCKLLK